MPKLIAALLAGVLLSPVAFADDAKADKKEAAPLPRVAHVELSGELEEGATDDEPMGGSGLRAMLDRIQKAAKDDKVTALYLELGSLEIGFGKVNELRQAITDFRKCGKKVFAWAESLGTKEYLVALACDTVRSAWVRTAT